MMKIPLQSMCLDSAVTPGSAGGRMGMYALQGETSSINDDVLAAVPPPLGRGKEESKGVKLGGKSVMLFRRPSDEVQSAAVTSCPAPWSPCSERFTSCLIVIV